MQRLMLRGCILIALWVPFLATGASAAPRAAERVGRRRHADALAPGFSDRQDIVLGDLVGAHSFAAVRVRARTASFAMLSGP